MANTAADGKCARCGRVRLKHEPDGEGLRLMCADGGRFVWPRSSSRAATSFSLEEVEALERLLHDARLRARTPDPMLGRLAARVGKMRQSIKKRVDKLGGRG